MKQAQTGDKVAVHYKGTRSDGAVFDSSLERDPIQFTIGGGEVIAGFDDALVDMAVGDTKTVIIAPEEAYGPRNPELVHVVERNQLPAELDLKVGAQLQATDPNGNELRLEVAEMAGDNVTLDANHPLAGESLTFEITLQDFVD